MSDCFSGKNTFVGHKHFWQSDYTVSRRRGWMASLKMSSQRVIGVESLNGDNMRGYYMADGALYVYKDASEYYDIFPLWDWRRLPGITAYLNDNSPMPQPDKRNVFSNKSRFVGGLSDGNNGISVLSLRKDGLSADKFWFFADSVVLCLGAGIESDSILDVATSVEQCWNKGKIRIFRGAERLDFDNNHQYETTDLRILHNGTGYLFMQGGGKCMVDVSNVNGSWYDIMQMYPDSDVYGDVFSVYINHGNCPSDASYSYMVIPETDEVSLKSFDISSYCILENNSNVQALLHDNICWAAVRRPSKLQLSESVGVDFRTAGLYRIRMEDGIVESVIYSDPTQQLDAMSLMINDNIISSTLPDGEMKGTAIELLFDK